MLVYDRSRRENAVIIKDVEIKNSLRYGLGMRESDVTVKDSIFSYNGEEGVIVVGEEENYPTKVQFEGIVSSHHNSGAGILLRPGKGSNPPNPNFAEISVKGVLNTYLNTDNGLGVNANSDMDFTVLDSGSVNSCENTSPDIEISDSAPNFMFVDEGKDGYTCDATGDGLPTCVSCPSCTD